MHDSADLSTGLVTDRQFQEHECMALTVATDDASIYSIFTQACQS